MSQTTLVILILGGVLGAVVLLGLITQWLAPSPEAWRELARRYPPEPASPDAQASGAKIRVLREEEADRPRRGCAGCLFGWWGLSKGYVQATMRLDDDHLHLDLDSGVAGPRSPMSIPWASIDVGSSQDSHLGEHVVLRVDEFVALVPSVSIERELEIRRMLELDEPDAAPEDPNAV
jgi:hypothetical protein